MELHSKRLKQGSGPGAAVRCSLTVRDGQPHDAPWDGVAPCAVDCRRSYCHKHALLLRRSHVSDGILDIKDAQGLYHPRHKGRKPTSFEDNAELNDKQIFNAAFGSSYGIPGRRTKTVKERPTIFELGPSTRLTWAAITYPNCIPIDHRSRLGFYDNKVSQFPDNHN